MPTYEYQCMKCGGITEVFQGITERAKRRLDCTVCGRATPVRRLLSTGVGIVFKGSGFYATDYRSESYKKAAKADQPAVKSKSDSAEPSAAPAAKAHETSGNGSGPRNPNCT
jgi:putative FmdB family regulatory protein